MEELECFAQKWDEEDEAETEMLLLDSLDSLSDEGYGHSRGSSGSILSEESCIESLLSLNDSDTSQLEGKIHEGNRFNRCLATISGHIGMVSCLALSGDLLLSGSHGKDIRAWKHPDLHEYTRFGDGEGAVKALVTVGDKVVVSAHQDHRIRVWKRQSGNKTKASAYKLVTTMPTFKDYISNFMAQSNYVQTRRHHKCLWIEHADTISCLAVGSGSGKKKKKKSLIMYSGSWDRTFKVWRMRDFKCMESVRAHDDAINALAVGPAGFLYTASADCKVKVWRKVSSPRNNNHRHQPVATLEAHKSSVNALAVSTDGRLVYSGGSDRGIVAWETELGVSQFSLADNLRGHHLAVLCLCTVGDLLCSGSADKTIRLWRRDDQGGRFMHSTVAVLQGHRGPVKCISASANVAAGSLIYSGSLDRSIKVWWVSAHDKPQHQKRVIDWI